VENKRPTEIMNLSIYCAFVGGFSTSNNSSQSNRKKCTYNFNVYIDISFSKEYQKERLCGTNFSIVPALYIYSSPWLHTWVTSLYPLHHRALFVLDWICKCVSIGDHIAPRYSIRILIGFPNDWTRKKFTSMSIFFHIRSYTVHTHLYRFLITKWPADDKTSKVVNHLPWRKNRPGLVIKRKILETYFYNNPYCWLVGQGVSPVRIRFDIFVGWGGGYCVCLREKVSTCLCVRTFHPNRKSFYELRTRCIQRLIITLLHIPLRVSHRFNDLSGRGLHSKELRKMFRDRLVSSKLFPPSEKRLVNHTQIHVEKLY
jgi:hypothetical protein